LFLVDVQLFNTTLNVKISRLCIILHLAANVTDYITLQGLSVSRRQTT